MEKNVSKRTETGTRAIGHRQWCSGPAPGLGGEVPDGGGPNEGHEGRVPFEVEGRYDLQGGRLRLGLDGFLSGGRPTAAPPLRRLRWGKATWPFGVRMCRSRKISK